MPGVLEELDDGQRRVVAVLAAIVLLLAVAVGALALKGGDDDSDAAVETGGSTTSSTGLVPILEDPSSTTSTSRATASSTSTTARRGSTTTTRRVGGGGGTGTTKAPTATTRPPATTTPTTQPPSGGACATGGGAAGQLATIFCNHRAQLGRPAMSRNAELDAMAQDWAQRMATAQTLSHRPSAEARTMVAAACPCPGWAENVAYDDTVQDAFNGWLTSTSGHRQHIEDARDGEYGLGVASAGGYLWLVQVFGYYG